MYWPSSDSGFYLSEIERCPNPELCRDQTQLNCPNTKLDRYLVINFCVMSEIKTLLFVLQTFTVHLIRICSASIFVPLVLALVTVK